MAFTAVLGIVSIATDPSDTLPFFSASVVFFGLNRMFRGKPYLEIVSGAGALVKIYREAPYKEITNQPPIRLEVPHDENLFVELQKSLAIDCDDDDSEHYCYTVFLVAKDFRFQISQTQLRISGKLIAKLLARYLRVPLREVVFGAQRTLVDPDQYIN